MGEISMSGSMRAASFGWRLLYARFSRRPDVSRRSPKGEDGHAHVLDCSFRQRRTCLRHGTTGQTPVSDRNRRRPTGTCGGVGLVAG